MILIPPMSKPSIVSSSSKVNVKVKDSNINNDDEDDKGNNNNKNKNKINKNNNIDNNNDLKNTDNSTKLIAQQLRDSKADSKSTSHSVPNMSNAITILSDSGAESAAVRETTQGRGSSSRSVNTADDVDLYSIVPRSLDVDLDDSFSNGIDPGHDSDDNEDGRQHVQFLQRVKSVYDADQYLASLIEKRVSFNFLVTTPPMLDHRLWAFLSVRRLAKDLNLLAVALYKDGCAAKDGKCAEAMQVGPRVVVCSSHERPQKCPAMEYVWHTLDWAMDLFSLSNSLSNTGQ